MFSVNILLYGAHSDLAGRCLGSIAGIADWPLIEEVRLGLNVVDVKTREKVTAFCSTAPCRTLLYEEATGRNVGKYPLMRRMFHDEARPITAPWIMWFDDDSWLNGDRSWWRALLDAVQSYDMAGHLYGIAMRPGQADAIRRASWYAGVPFLSDRKTKAPKFQFMTGAWWAVRSEFVKRWSWPFAELHHRGGDSMMGELCRQRCCRMLDIRKHEGLHKVQVNDGPSRELFNTPWIWQGFSPQLPVPDLKHQDFQVRVTPGATLLPLLVLLPGV